MGTHFGCMSVGGTVMELSEFVSVIHGTGKFIGNPVVILKDIFQNAGSVIPKDAISDNTVKCWLKPLGHPGHRNCKIREYFPHDKVNEDGFVRYFSKRLTSQWTV